MDNGKGDLENFTDWKERFEMVAEAYHWDERTKFVNLVTRLCGQAYSFYRSCDGSQRSCYTNRDWPIMLIFYLLCYATVLKIFTYYAQYYAETVLLDHLYHKIFNMVTVLLEYI